MCRRTMGVLFGIWVSACGGGGEGGGTGGAGGDAACAALEAEHAQLLETARSCNPAAASPGCTLEAKRDLGCGCTTFVNASQAVPAQKLGELADKYQGLGCGSTIFCKCAPPKSATCEGSPSGTQGVCTDVY